MSIEQLSVHANGVHFACLATGSGPLALCLHGFPDSPHGYRYLMQELADAGYRAVAPYLRGYAPSSIPTDGDYSTPTLAADVSALHAALGGDHEAVLIGHDWGACIAYSGALHRPENWRRCVMMSVPPLAVFWSVAFRYEQLKRSFYFWMFQMDIAEAVVAADDLAFLDQLWRDWSPALQAAEDLERAKRSVRAPENLRAALGYYRGLFHPQEYGMANGLEKQGLTWGRQLLQRTLYLHGENDGCFVLDESDVSKTVDCFGPGSEAILLEDVGHFLLLEKPREVNARILAFLGREPLYSDSPIGATRLSWVGSDRRESKSFC